MNVNKVVPISLTNLAVEGRFPADDKHQKHDELIKQNRHINQKQIG
jgi:hypothetical protein